MNKRKIILVGGGDFTKKVIRLVSQFNNLEIIGYTDIENKGDLFGVKYLGTDDGVRKKFKDISDYGVIICIAGNISIIKKKEELIDFYKNLGCYFPTIVSPKAYVDNDVEIGDGVLIFDNTYIDFNVQIESFAVINLMALICHDALIGYNSVISPKAIVAGGARIKENCFVGSNATINPYLEITSNVIIGSGSVVNKSIMEAGVYVGNPTKRVYKK